MITRDQLLKAIVHECDVCKHLHTKFTQEGFEYRPTPGQRSTLELMRYLSVCAIGSLRYMVDGNWDAWRQLGQNAESMTPTEFPEAMDRQVAELRALFDSIPDEDFITREVTHPTGEVMPLGYGIMKMPLLWLTAYRMQLFLYAKSAGAHELNTANCWSGVDWKRPEAEPVEADAA